MLPNPFDDRPAQWRRKSALLLVLLLALNGASWLAAWVAFAAHPVLWATAILAYIFGVRHAFDADHIAAIDNVVRKLMQQGRAPSSVGFFFSLGHSTIVVLASVAIAATAATIDAHLGWVHDMGGMVGTAVSAVFLLIIGAANLLVLRTIWRVYRRARRGEAIAEVELEPLLASRGMFSRLFHRLFNVVTASWQMYFVGFLFGLGFDTATEIGLLGISATQAAHGMSFWEIMVYPVLFTAGMSLLDSLDSICMTGAYGWALRNPLRKLWFNLTVTAASVVVAVFIGGVEALGLLGHQLALDGRFWRAVGGLNDNLTDFGFAVVGVFVSSWLVAALIYRLRGIGQFGEAG